MAKKAHKRPGLTPGRSANSKAAIKQSIKKKGASLPTVRDKKGRLRSMTVKELKDYKNMLNDLPKFGKTISKNSKEVKEYFQQAADWRRKHNENQLSSKGVKQLHGVIPKITKKEGYGYIQAGSAGNFIHGELHLKRNVVVRRKGKDTVIDSPQKELELIRAIKGARSKYRQVLRERAKSGKSKISDVMFIATHREGKNTIIDVDAIEYGGLSIGESIAEGLR